MDSGTFSDSPLPTVKKQHKRRLKNTAAMEVFGVRAAQEDPWVQVEGAGGQPGRRAAGLA